MLGVVQVPGVVVAFNVVVFVLIGVVAVGCSLRSVSVLTHCGGACCARGGDVSGDGVDCGVCSCLVDRHGARGEVTAALLVVFLIAGVAEGGDCRCGDSNILAFALCAGAVLSFACLFLGLSYHLLVLPASLSLCFAFGFVLQKYGMVW